MLNIAEKRFDLFIPDNDKLHQHLLISEVELYASAVVRNPENVVHYKWIAHNQLTDQQYKLFLGMIKKYLDGEKK